MTDTGLRRVVPPLPEMSWNGYFWVGHVTLPSWKGFQSRLGPYNAMDSMEPSDGRVRLSVGPPLPDSSVAPSVDQLKAFQFLLDNDSELNRAVCAAIADEYPNMIAPYDPVEAEDLGIAQHVAADDLPLLMGLSQVHVLHVVHGGEAMIGFELGCTWEPEHGLGALTHRGRVLEVGLAEVAYTEWIAERAIGPKGTRPRGA